MTPEASDTRRRLVGVDVARGLAVLLMVQTHAYDAWVRSDERASFAYNVTRALGAIPAPLFLFLAGVGIALAEARARDARALRTKLARRGLEIVLWGYVVSLAYAALDASLRVASLLRADILHAIGLSIAICAVLLVGVGERSRVLGTALLVAVALAAGPAFAWAGGARVVPPLARPIVALVVDVPPYTRFPVLPLVVFSIAGIFFGRWLGRAREARSVFVWIGGAVAMAALSALLAIATRAAVAAIGGRLSREHPAVVINVLDGLARSLAVVLLGLGLDVRAPRWLVRLGQASLFAYAFHIPFCYARFARPLWHRFGMLEATGLVIALMALTFAAVALRDAVEARLVARTRRSR